MGIPAGHRSDPPRTRWVISPWMAALVSTACLLVPLILLAERGPHRFGAGIATVLQLWIESGGVALAWFLAALGLGRFVRAGALWQRDERDAAATASGGWTIQLGAGVALMLTLSHALGASGAWSGSSAVWIAWAPIALGLVLLLQQIRQRDNRPEVWGGAPLVALLAIPGCAVLIVSACLAPGTMWASEAHGYDSLSYHLQLPREWLERGYVEPLTHNVYSCLPNYMEAAFTHLGAMFGGATATTNAFSNDAASAVFASQALHVLMALATAIGVGRFVSLTLRGISSAPRAAASASIAGTLAGTAVLVSPWVSVVGSMAYSEMTVTLMFAVALVVTREPGLRPVMRGGVIGLLMGAAIGAKLTAAYMVVPSLVIAICAWTPWRHWIAIFSGASMIGVATLSGWLIRNGAALGNPIFPFATSVFGSAHWNAEQVQRWNGAHHFDGSVVDRLAILVSIQRGALHAQWFIFYPVVVGGGVVALFGARTRRIAAVLLAMIGAGLCAWLAVGHLQSRFLLPLIVTGSALFGIGAWAGLSCERHWKRQMTALASGALLLALGAGTVTNYLMQNDWRPTQALIGGAGAINGALARNALPLASDHEARQVWENLPPAALVNLALDSTRKARGATPPSTALVYLLGDATPLYFQVPTIYSTTWDASPFGDALGRHENDVSAALWELHARGVTHILVNLDEVSRLESDGWNDPAVTFERVWELVRGAGDPERVGRFGAVIVRQWAQGKRLGAYLLELKRQAWREASPEGGLTREAQEPDGR